MILLISSALISSAIFAPDFGYRAPTSRAHQSLFHLRLLCLDRSVIDQAADSGDHSADDLRISTELQPHLFTSLGLQFIEQQRLLPIADLAGGGDLGRHQVLPVIEFTREG